MTVTTALAINSQRLWASLIELAAIGATPKGSVRRLALSEIDGQARGHLRPWRKQAGGEGTVSGIGYVLFMSTIIKETLPSVTTGNYTSSLIKPRT